nr:hypothetical protein [Alcaligenes faecalis]
MLDPEKILAGARSWVTFSPDSLLPELLAFGEVEVANRFTQLDAQAIAAIGVLASRHYSSPDRPFLDKAICMGIVEFIEGQPRPLKRKRRIYPKAELG